MQTGFLDTANALAPTLVERGETITVTETSTGGLISAMLLAVPGASAYFKGATVPYSLQSRRQWLAVSKESVVDLQPMSEAMAMRFAQIAKEQLGSTWGLAELGIAGPTGAPYGVAAGTSVIAVAGPNPQTMKVVTGNSDRQQNMLQFAASAMVVLARALAIDEFESRH